MYKFITAAFLFLFNITSYAIELPDNAFFLDKVRFQISAKKWVSTNNALLTVNINATLGNEELVKAREQILLKLNEIAPGDWHIIRFDRSQDSSGLDTLNIVAQVKAEQTKLTDAYKNAKRISKPGANYEIQAIEFKPDLQELQTAKNELRQILYMNVHRELEQINKVFTNQSYSVSSIEFIDEPGIVPQPQLYRSREMMAAKADANAPAPDISLENELVMNAIIELASNRKIAFKNI